MNRGPHLLDPVGRILGLLRLDGANPSNTELALAKARASAITRVPSRVWADRIKAGQLLMLTLPYAAPQGGLPRCRRRRHGLSCSDILAR